MLQNSKMEKYLGVWMDDSLKLSDHVLLAAKKANQMLGMIKRSFNYLDMSTVKLLYVCMIRPHLEDGNVVWHPRFKKDMNLLVNVQHRATRMIPGFRNLSYEERLRRLDLPTLTYRRLGEMLRLSLANNSSSTSPHSPSPPVAPPDFSVFKPTSESEVCKILFNSPNKQSDSDASPTWLLKECASVIIPTITNIVNLSLSSGHFHPLSKSLLFLLFLKNPP